MKPICLLPPGWEFLIWKADWFAMQMQVTILRWYDIKMDLMSIWKAERILFWRAWKVYAIKNSSFSFSQAMKSICTRMVLPKHMILINSFLVKNVCAPVWIKPLVWQSMKFAKKLKKMWMFSRVRLNSLTILQCCASIGMRWKTKCCL